MTDFDKLIKEKVEKATYSYKASDWKDFQRKAGVYRGSAKYWVAGAAALIAGASLVVTLHHRNMSSPIPEQQMVAQDTVLSVEPQQTSDQLSGEGTAKLEVVAPEGSKASAKSAGHVVSEQAKTTASKEETVTDTKQTSVRQTLGRPLVIDVDTIKDNVPSDEELKNGHSRLF